jgi:hypothetical protein
MNITIPLLGGWSFAAGRVSLFFIFLLLILGKGQKRLAK